MMVMEVIVGKAEKVQDLTGVTETIQTRARVITTWVQQEAVEEVMDGQIELTKNGKNSVIYI
jgi:hypothetical protein